MNFFEHERRVAGQFHSYPFWVAMTQSHYAHFHNYEIHQCEVNQWTSHQTAREQHQSSFSAGSKTLSILRS